jgi:N-acetylneuraminate lyase
MAGVKAFVSDLSVHQLLLMRSPAAWQIMHGFDQCLLQALTIPGITTAIGSTYNVVPELVIAILNAAKEGNYDAALALNQKFSAYWASIHGFSFLEFGRSFLQERGFQMGPPRAPLRQPSAKEIEIVKHRMQSQGFKLNALEPITN